MIERFLGSTWTLVAAWILGPLVLIWMVRRRVKENRRAAGPKASADVTPSAAKRGSAVMPAPATAERREITPGFRDARWEEGPKPDMTVFHDDGEEKLYSRANEELSLDGAELSQILYSFHRDRLQAVMIEMPLGSADAVFRGRCAVWGTPKQPNPRQHKYFWLDLLAGMDATQAVFERNAMAGKASLVISSKGMQETRERERATASKS